MTGPRTCSNQIGAIATLTRFRLGQAGTAIVELVVAVPLFLLLYLGLLDFARLGYTLVMAESALDMAARIAVVRPPACPGVATVNQRGSNVAPPFGTSCAAGSNICANPGTVTCAGSTTNATAAEIWTAVSPLMPTGTTVANLTFSYSYDSNLGFLGGPYVPVVSVALQGASFQFVTPLAGLARLASGTPSSLAASLNLPPLSAALPGEDLALGG